MRNALFLAFTIVAVGLLSHLSYVATFGRSLEVDLRPAAFAIGITLFGTIPPLLFSPRMSLGIATPLVLFGWRFGMLIPTALMLKRLEGAERNCFVVVLLACYFVALVLESWLFIRGVRHNDADLPQPKR